MDRLIDRESSCRDLNKVKALLPPKAVAEVQKIIFTPSYHEDRLIWEQEKDRVYSVKSVDKLMMGMMKRNQEGQSSRAEDQKHIQKEIWKFQTPNRIRVFAWRACKESLPTLHNLKQREVLVDEVCPFYGEEVEDLVHAIFSYPTIEEN